MLLQHWSQHKTNEERGRREVEYSHQVADRAEEHYQPDVEGIIVDRIGGVVLAGVSMFAIMIRPFGLLPAIAATVVVLSLAELKVKPVSLVALCVFLCALSWLVFRVGLGMSLPLASWPF